MPEPGDSPKVQEVRRCLDDAVRFLSELKGKTKLTALDERRLEVLVAELQHYSHHLEALNDKNTGPIRKLVDLFAEAAKHSFDLFGS